MFRTGLLMSLSKRLIIILFFSSLLFGCSSDAVISYNKIDSSVYQKVGQIALIGKNKSRTDQLFRQKFERLVHRGGLGEPQYHLTANISSSQSDHSMTMTLSFSLTEIKTGETLLNRSFSSSATIGGVSSIFGKDQAINHARERLSYNLAEKAYRYFLLYFTQKS